MKEDVSSFDAFVTAGYREVVEKKNRKFAFSVLNMGMRQTQIDPHGPELNIGGDRAFRMAQIIWHMWYHRFFLPENYVRENLHKIKDIPGFIEAGRYDTNTVLKSAWELHTAWPKASLLIYTGAHADEGVYVPGSGIRSSEMAEGREKIALDYKRGFRTGTMVRLSKITRRLLSQTRFGFSAREAGSCISYEADRVLAS